MKTLDKIIGALEIIQRVREQADRSYIVKGELDLLGITSEDLDKTQKLLVDFIDLLDIDEIQKGIDADMNNNLLPELLKMCTILRINNRLNI